jgi:hypothetical protein
VISLKNYKINNWFRCKNTQVNLENKKNIDSILVIQDMNTLSEELELNKFSVQNLKEFIKLSLDEQSNILKNVFQGVK